MWNSTFCHAALYVLVLLAVTVQCHHSLVSSSTNLHPRFTAGPGRRQLNESRTVRLYGDSSHPELNDIYKCNGTEHIAGPIAALREANLDVLESLQDVDESGRVVTQLTNLRGEMQKYVFDSTQLTNPSVAWYPALVDALTRLDQDWPLPEDGKPPLGGRAARNVKALLWDSGYATYTNLWWNLPGTVNYFAQASDKNQILLAYTKTHQILPVLPWSPGYAPLSAIRDMSHPENPVWPPEVNADRIKLGTSVLMPGDLAWNVTVDWTYADFKENVTILICSD